MGTAALDDLVVFVAVSETRSFSAAARRLQLPKSSVSRAIARLEAATGMRLVHRTTRQVALSTVGTALYEKVAVPLSSIRASLGELPEREEQLSGAMRVTAPPDFGEAILAEMVARFTALHPQLEVELLLTNELVDIVAEGIDLALRFVSRGLKDSSLSARRIAPSIVQLFASPSYLVRRGVPRTPRDLDAHEWVRFRGSPTLRLEGPDEIATIKPRGRVIANDMAFVRAALLQDAGIGLLPTFVADAEVAAGRLIRVLPRWSAQTASLWLVRPGGREVPRKVTAFTELLVETLRARGLVSREARPG